MIQYSEKLTTEVAKLDAEIQDLEKRMEISEAELSQVVFRVNAIIDEEIGMVDLT